MTQTIYNEVKIIIADDHDIFLDGLISIFEKEKLFTIIDKANNGLELLECLKTHEPDVILIDIQMPKMNGIEATKIIKEKYPQIEILALTFRDDDDSLIEMIEAGANGYIIKSAHKNEIIEGICAVYNGSNFYCKNMNLKLVELAKNNNFNRHNRTSKVSFTEKELKIIKYICQEFSAKDIATKLGGSKRTIENQKLKIQEKMNVHTSAGIAVYALKKKLVKI
jgi:DNA-binding NarL/FixJ family response regulator